MINLEFYTADVLLDRLTAGLKRIERPVTFLVGSAFSAPDHAGSPGVPTTSGVIELIRQEFDGQQLKDLDNEIAYAPQPYQAAFHFLQGRRGQEVANEVIKRAVWAARKPLGESTSGIVYRPTGAIADETCRISDDDIEGWYLPPAHKALGELITRQPLLFGGSVLTTNFDPLIEVSVSLSGGSFYRTVVHRDGHLGQTHGSGCHIIHLHGYWYGADTLHTPRQIEQARPRLKASLSHLISGRTIVVSGYGGWDDIFTRALIDLVLDDHVSPDIIWTFRDREPQVSPELVTRLGPGIDRGRVLLYGGVDCHEFLPRLATAWIGEDASPASTRFVYRPLPPQGLVDIGQSAPIKRGPPPTRRVDFSRGEQDHPPKVDFYVGRDKELAILRESVARVFYLTGIGGQGKSALAAQYYARAQDSGAFEHYIWRDCKEESERFERQLISIVVALSGRRVRAHDLASQPIEAVTEVFLNLSRGLRILLIFDNLDHYVDLDRAKLTGGVGRFIEKLLKADCECRVVFTCRPAITHAHAKALSHRLEGLSFDETVELFGLREAVADANSVKRIHELTRGHAFWLDLIAAHLARRAQQIGLDDLLSSFDSDTPELPTATLRSIWNTMREREHTVLQALAETVRPTSILQLSYYLAPKLRYNQLLKAVNYLKAVNLLVIKPQEDGQELMELHPLVRTFVRTTFARVDRDWFIHAILAVYQAFFGIHRSDLSKKPAPGTLDHWTEGAELHIAAGEYADALDCLYEIIPPIRRTESPNDFIRVTGLLLQSFDWSELAQAKHFDDVISAYVEIQALAGHIEECSSTLEHYSETLEGKDARYIGYCDLRCYVHWANRDFLTAIKWGSEGVALKAEAGLDTRYDASHNLALAQRDSGAIDPALQYFLKGDSLSDVVGADPPNEKRGGEFYGNIGRCLHLMGQIAPALSCYRKSATLIEKDTSSASNRAYIRQWVGEILLGKGDTELGLAILEAAKAKWEFISPPTVTRIDRMIADVLGDRERPPISVDGAEKTFFGWMRRREEE